MKVIGLTGPTGAGKTDTAKEFEKYGFRVIDTDLVAREVVGNGSPCLLELSNEFGGSILDENGELIRKKLAEAVFKNRTEVEKLNKITHKYILAKVNEKITEFEAAGVPAVIVEGAALIESGFCEKCIKIIVVTASRPVRLKRIMERDGISSLHAAERIAAQFDDTFYIEHANYVLENNSGKEALSKQIEEIAKSILKDD